MTSRIPFVDYLQLSDPPALIVNRCANCKAAFFDRRNGCASCFADTFTREPIPTEGELVSFTIVAFAGPDIPTPYVSAVVACGDTLVNANLVNVDPTPEHVRLGMPVQLTLISKGFDAEGKEAVAFGFEPATHTSQTSPAAQGLASKGTSA